MSDRANPFSPWSTEWDNFLGLIVASGLLGLPQVVDAINESGARDVAALGKHLIATKLLTVWQCNKLRDGRYKGFFLDNYKLLDILSIDERRYLAENTETGDVVELVVVHDPAAPYGIRYEVVSS